MAKATESDTTALSVSEAAAAIVRLINEKPNSPTVEEIAALIGRPAAQGGLVLTISGVAREIADLYELRDVLEAGEFRQNKLLADNTDEPCVAFEEHKTAADIRKDTLEMVLLQLEPESVDEVLALVLLTASTFEGWAGDVSTEHEMSVRAEREWQILTHAFEAMTRWLVHRGGAKSPLLRAGYFRDGWLAPPAEQIATALARAREIEQQAGRSEGGDNG